MFEFFMVHIPHFLFFFLHCSYTSFTLFIDLLSTNSPSSVILAFTPFLFELPKTIKPESFIFLKLYQTQVLENLYFSQIKETNLVTFPLFLLISFRINFSFSFNLRLTKSLNFLLHSKQLFFKNIKTPRRF